MVLGNPDHLDLEKLKGLVRKESAHHKLRLSSEKADEIFTLGLALSAAVKKVFYEKSERLFSSEPRLERKLITQFVHRMRVDAMEKFNKTTVFSTINFALDEKALERKNYAGTVVIYLEQEFLPEFLRLLKYPYIDYDNEVEAKDGCGAVANLIGGYYKKEMIALGYKELTMSHFASYINFAPDGVGIPRGLTHKYEVNFEIDGVKRLVVEMVMAHLQRAVR